MGTIFLLVKFFEKEIHAKKFVHGEIFARKLSEFKQAEDSNEPGRMDRNEGTTVLLQPGKCSLKINGMDISEDLAGPLQVQMDWVGDLNVFCLHATHSGDLDLASLSNDNVEALRQELTIPKKCLCLGKYAVVVMNVPEFINRMRSFARAKNYPGIKWGLVEYYDPETFHGTFPDEEAAFRKQKDHSYQREFRFAMNSGSSGPLIMNIGDISDSTLQLESSELNGEKLLGGKLELQTERSLEDEDRSGIIKGEEKGNADLRKGAVLQHSGPRRIFKSLGVAKRYCTVDSDGDTFVLAVDKQETEKWVGTRNLKQLCRQYRRRWSIRDNNQTNRRLRGFANMQPICFAGTQRLRNCSRQAINGACTR